MNSGRGGWLLEEFDRWWGQTGEWIEEPNQCRGGHSGVQVVRPTDPGHPVLYVKRQSGHVHRSLRHLFGRPTVLREQQAYHAFAGCGVLVPQIVYCAARKYCGQWQAILVTEALDGFVSLDQWYRKGRAQASGPERKRIVLRQIASTLASLHRARWQHGCCYPKHIFVRDATEDPGKPQINVALLDLEKCRRRWRIRDVSRRDLGQLFRHRGAMPEEDWTMLRDHYQHALKTAA